MTDVVMPGKMNGWDLARKVRLDRPGLPVLYISGYTDAFLVREGRLEPGEYLLAKQFRKADLARLLRQALNGQE